jgi:hypothetical protein
MKHGSNTDKRLRKKQESKKVVIQIISFCNYQCFICVSSVATRPRFKLLDAFNGNGVMDTDLDQMTREQLIAEVKKLRSGIRAHRDSSRHELCWHHPSLWGLLPEPTDPLPVVPEWPEFMRGCVRYRQSLDEQAPNAPRTNERYEP